jgi:hypothetical protein
MLMESHQWVAACPLLQQLWEESGRTDVLCCLRLGIALTASAGTDLRRYAEGEAVLRTLAQHPMFAQGRVWLARNLAAQYAVNRDPRIRAEAIQEALAGLFDAAEAPDCVDEALKVLSDVEYEGQSSAFARAQGRYPQLALNPALQSVDPSKPLWARGKQWLSTEPKGEEPPKCFDTC